MSRVSFQSDRLRFQGQLDLASLMTFRQELDDVLPPSCDMVVDLADLTVEDSAGLALLVYLVRRIRGDGCSVSFEHASQQLRQMAELAGLSGLIGLNSP